MSDEIPMRRRLPNGPRPSSPGQRCFIRSSRPMMINPAGSPRKNMPKFNNVGNSCEQVACFRIYLDSGAGASCGKLTMVSLVYDACAGSRAKSRLSGCGRHDAGQRGFARCLPCALPMVSKMMPVAETCQGSILEPKPAISHRQDILVDPGGSLVSVICSFDFTLYFELLESCVAF